MPNKYINKMSLNANEELLAVLEEIRASATSVPLTETLPESERNHIAELLKDLWVTHIEAKFNNALLKCSEEKNSPASQFSQEQTESYLTETKKFFEYDNLKDVKSLEEIKTAVHKFLNVCEKKLANELAENKENKSPLQKANLEKLITGIRLGILQLSQFEAAINAYPDTNAEERKISFIFPAAGAFIGVVCGVLASPVFAVAKSIENVVSWVFWGFKDGLYPLLGLYGVISMFAIGISIAITTPFLAIESAINAVLYMKNTGADLAKKASNKEYNAKADLLYAIAKLDISLRGMPDPSFTNALYNMLPYSNEYFSLLHKTNAAHAKFTGVSELRKHNPSLTAKLRKYFIVNLNQLNKAIFTAKFISPLIVGLMKILPESKAKDKNRLENSNNEEAFDPTAILEKHKDYELIHPKLEEMVNELEDAWKAITTQLKDNNIHAACDAADVYLKKEKEHDLKGSNRKFMLHDYLEYSARKREYLEQDLTSLQNDISIMREKFTIS